MQREPNQHHHHHHHHHHHTVPINNINRAFIIGIALNFLFVIIEVGAGLYIHSLSLLSDAGHNLADVAALALSLLAFRLIKMKPTDQYTYGYRKTTILVALFNSVVLFISIGAILYEAAHRFFNPEPLQGNIIAIIAAIGIVINISSALLFFKQKEKDLNIKSAYLHLISDALVSFGIVIGGIIIYYTNYYWIDSVLSIVLVIIIIYNTWDLLKQSLKLSLDGVPEDLNLDTVRQEAEEIEGIKNIHHIHLWALSTTSNALTAHIVVDKSYTFSQIESIKKKLKHRLEHLNIQHATLEVESEQENCDTQDCL